MSEENKTFTIMKQITLEDFFNPKWRAKELMLKRMLEFCKVTNKEEGYFEYVTDPIEMEFNKSEEK